MHFNRSLVAVGVAFALFAGSSDSWATVIQSASGISAKGVEVAFEAHLTISGDVLTIELINTSPVASLNPDDVLGSYYFDIFDGGNNRPALTYTSATGDVYLADMDNPDTLDTAGADLLADTAGDYTWAYKAMDENFTPFLGFGLGTVGNSTVAPNNFMGNIVDGIDFSIYKGDVTTSNLDGKLLVKDSATFVFSGATGFDEGDISPFFQFGLGTAPDSFIPTPGSAMLLAAGGGLWLRRRRR